MISISADEAIKHSLSFESPTEYRPVVHAHWIMLYPNKFTGRAFVFACSNCGQSVTTERPMFVDELGYEYCPHCGARVWNLKLKLSNRTASKTEGTDE